MFNNIEKKENEYLYKYSTIRIGGKARYILYPKSYLELNDIFKGIFDNNLRYYIVGNCSNILFDDNGFDGVIISLKRFDKITMVDNDSVLVDAGVNLYKLNNFLLEKGLSGIEWSYGIPATLGGLTIMNGGCFGFEISKFIDYILLAEIKYDEKTNKNTLFLRKKSKKDIIFDYRYSNLKNCIILKIKLNLKTENKNIILDNMLTYYNKKISTQPCDVPSLGSVFKIVQSGGENIYPAKLIDNLGFKGVKIGGAEVSKKHAGFIVNSNNATSKDVLDLIELLQTELLKLGVVVEKEIVVL